MSDHQSGIFADVPPHARYLFYTLVQDSDIRATMDAVRPLIDGHNTVIGLGSSALNALGKTIPGMKTFPAMSHAGIDIPSTPSALVLWLRGEDRGELLHRTRQLSDALAPSFELEDVVESFKYRDGDDLTGYEDGTENPEGDDAINAAVVQGAGDELDGSSFVAIQQWVHDLDTFQLYSTDEQDNMIGRQISDNEEIEDAPESAHVKRTAQEDFEPEAFVLRRSMPWSAAEHEGLMFVAFGKSFAAYEALLNRMIGKDDGIVDALFSFTRPITGGYYWCPPMLDGNIRL